MLSSCRGSWIALISAVVLAMLLEHAGSRAASQAPLRLVVIVHPALREHELDIDDLRAIFLRKRLQWSGGQHIVPLNQLPDTPGRSAFDATVLGFERSDAARYWVDVRIRSGIHPPRGIAGETTIAAVVRALPGSIGYVTPEHLNPGVRVVARVEAGKVRAP
jgi:hypothetical protein